MPAQKSDMVMITGLWQEEGKKGGTYLAGSVRERIVIPEGARLMVFKNKWKDDDKKPDYKLHFAPPSDDYAPGKKKGGGSRKGTDDDDDMPF